MEFKTALKHSWCLAPLFFEAEPPLQHSGENPRNEELLSDKLVGAPLFIFKKLRDCPDEKSKCPDPLFDVQCSEFPRIPISANPCLTIRMRSPHLKFPHSPTKKPNPCTTLRSATHSTLKVDGVVKSRKFSI
jgi:hypothetical protein